MEYVDHFQVGQPRIPKELSLPKRAWNNVAEVVELTSSLAGNIDAPQPFDQLFPEISLPEFDTFHKVPTALIAAAGKGTRMRPITLKTPKPLVEVAGKPLIDYTVDLLAQAGVRDYILNTEYLADQFEEYVEEKHNTRQGRFVTVNQSEVKNKLLSGDQRIVAKKALQNPFFVLGADHIIMPSTSGDKTKNPFARMIQAIHQNGVGAALLLCHQDQKVNHEGSGDYAVDCNNVIWKPDGSVDADHIFMGALVTRKFAASRVFKVVTNIIASKTQRRVKKAIGSSVDAKEAHNAIKLLSDPETGIFKGVSAVIHDGPFYDVSSPELRNKAEQAVLALRR